MKELMLAIFGISLLGIIASTVCTIPKTLRPKAQGFLGLFILLFIGSCSFGTHYSDKDAAAAGFESDADQRRAKEAGIADANKWREEKAKLVAIKQEQDRVKAEAVREIERKRADLIRYPKDELVFIAAVTDGTKQYKLQGTDLQKGAARPTRARAICAAVPARINRWAGQVASLSTNGEGKGVLKISLNDDAHIATWNNALSDIGSETLIDADSPLYRTLLTLKEGDWVRFDARFHREKTDCYQEQSLTLAGSMTAPVFLATFLRVERIDLPPLP